MASFSPHHYSYQQRSPFRLFIACQKLSNALKSLESKKSLQESTNRASTITTSYLQLAHARNSRVKNDKNSIPRLSNFCLQICQIKRLQSKSFFASTHQISQFSIAMSCFASHLLNKNLQCNPMIFVYRVFSHLHLITNLWDFCLKMKIPKNVFYATTSLPDWNKR